MRDYRTLRVWQAAQGLAAAIDALFESLPQTRRLVVIRDQLERAAASIANNIAEGCGAPTVAEFRRYLAIALKSTFEVENQLRMARETARLPERECLNLESRAVVIRRMLDALYRNAKDPSELPSKRTRQPTGAAAAPVVSAVEAVDAVDAVDAAPDRRPCSRR